MRAAWISLRIDKLNDIVDHYMCISPTTFPLQKLTYNAWMSGIQKTRNTVYDEAYGRLNTKQKEAVDTIEGPVMVIAGPGTGKTTILTLRIANILRQTDTPPGGILAITYTDAGVKAMRTKLQSIIGDKAHEVRIFTFHSFASAVIAEHPDHFLHLDDSKIMTDIEQESIIRSIISDPVFSSIRPSGKQDAYVGGIIRGIDDAKREALSPTQVRIHSLNEIERIKSDQDSISTRGATKGKLKAAALEAIGKSERTILFADVYERYESIKLESKKMDFNDLLIELLAALKNDELLLRVIQEKYLYIHVDEHQDTNDAQNFIVALIAEFFETPNIFIVGDEKQAIYRFQGASVENFLLLQKHWPSMKLISLDTNYRSHQSILDASFSMIEKNYEDGEHKDLRIRLKSPTSFQSTSEHSKVDRNTKVQSEDSSVEKRGRQSAAVAGRFSDGHAVNIITTGNVEVMEQELVKQIKAISVNEPKATVAIIVRRNRELDRLIRLLETNNIKVSSQRSVDIFKHPIGILFFDLIQFISDPTNSEALAKTVSLGLWDISLDQSIVLIRELRSGKAVSLDTKLNGYISIKNKLLESDPIGALIFMAQRSGFISRVVTDTTYAEVWRGIVALADSLIREGNIHEPLVLLGQLLTYRLSAESRIVKVSVGAPDVPIHAMTAHGSKGLEFDYVFIPYATDEAWVGKPRGASFVLPKKRTSESDIRDIRRLFYVALTRARNQVTILSPLEESDGKILSPLRFIVELDQNHVIHTAVGNEKLDSATSISAKMEKYVTKLDPENQSHKKLVDLAKRIILETGLSVTALNHFLECPSKFLFLSILKLPQAPSVPSEKGIAMHSAIDKVWKSENRTVDDIERIQTQSVADYFAQSFLNIADKAIAQKDLFQDIPVVARALEAHFALNGTASTETWVKTEFNGIYDNQTISIPIHGKLDAILDTGSEILVFDYKTRQAMSVNAIKGETSSTSNAAKSSGGNYFRQLIFYKILVGADGRWKGRNVIPALVFVSPDDKGRCPTITLPIEDIDIRRVKAEIQSLIDSVWSGKVAQNSCEEVGCEWCGMKKVFAN